MRTRIIVLALLALLWLCGMQASAQSNTYTGQQLFQGVFFGVGPVAQLVPELYQETNTTNQPAIDKSIYASNLTAQAAVLNSSGYPEDAGKVLRVAQRILNAPTNVSLIPQHVLSSLVQSNLMNEIDAQDGTFFARFATNIQSGNAVLVSAAIKEGSERLWTVVDTMPDAEYYAGVWAWVDTFLAVKAAVAVYKYLALIALAARPDQAAGYQFDDQISLLTARLNHNGPQPIPTVSEWGMIILILAMLVFGIYAIVKRQAKLKP